MKKSFRVLFLLLLIICIFVACSAEKNELGVIEPSTATNETVTETKNTSKNNTSEKNENVEIEKTVSSSTDPIDKNNTTESINSKVGDSKETTENNADNKDEIFTVTFKDYDGKVLKTEQVKKGGSATAPNKPTRGGYKFIKWNTAFDNVQVNITTTAVYDEIIMPTIIVEDGDCRAGETVAIKVSTLNNPGVLGILVNITYDENVMTLKKVENGSVMDKYVFTPPKNMKSGCNAAWNINDVPNEEKDGDILTLHFKVSRKAQTGSYPISVSCRGGAFDSEYKDVPFDTIDGALNIK